QRQHFPNQASNHFLYILKFNTGIVVSIFDKGKTLSVKSSDFAKIIIRRSLALEQPGFIAMQFLRQIISLMIRKLGDNIQYLHNVVIMISAKLRTRTF